MNLLGLSTHVLEMRCQNTQTLSSILPKGTRAESGFIHDPAPRQLPPLCMHVDTCCTGHSQWKTEITRTPSPEQSGCCGEEVAEGPPAYRHSSSLVINTATHKVTLRTKLCLYHHKTRQKIYMYIYILVLQSVAQSDMWVFIHILFMSICLLMLWALWHWPDSKRQLNCFFGRIRCKFTPEGFKNSGSSWTTTKTLFMIMRNYRRAHFFLFEM